MARLSDSPEVADSPDVAVDAAGDLYIADTFNHRVLRVDRAGIITTVAGTGKEAPLYKDTCSGDGGPAKNAQLHYPRALAVDAAGNLYIGGDHRVRRVDREGIITTVAELYAIGPIAVDATGNLYVGGAGVRRVDTVGMITSTRHVQTVGMRASTASGRASSHKGGGLVDLGAEGGSEGVREGDHRHEQSR